MGSCLAVVAIVLLLFVFVVVGVVGSYIYIAAQLPSPEELQARQSDFVSSKILDRDGNLLYEVVDPQGGLRTYTPIDEISPLLIQATVATEDRNFYQHAGFDPVALVRIIYYYIEEGDIVSGGSTITQQLARNLLLSPEERVQRTAWRKIKEIVLAYELTRRWDKNVILEVYLNELNYGNLAYGAQAAAETYFNNDASQLTLAQASFLAGLPQSPATYDVFSGGRDAALRRQQSVLALMVEAGYISQAEALAAAAEMQAYEFQAPPSDVFRAPHFVTYVRQVVEGLWGADALYRGLGLRIHTTLNPTMQTLAEQYVTEGVASLAQYNATNGALLAMDPSTGHILAMVGSADFYNEDISGQVNVALRCRQPGSSIKPLTYVAAFERGWTPATALWDVRTEFPDGANPPYVPVNYDGIYHGPMSLRTALANSYNVPAVEAMQFVGVNGLLEFSQRVGIRSLAEPQIYCPDYPYDAPPPYGLALTLGGGEVRLLEMVNAYAVFANGGVRQTPTPILYIEDSRGGLLLDNRTPQGEQAISPQHAYLITSILSDVQARCLAFHCPSLLELSRPAAAKTGTTNDNRDAWTIGYTPDLVTGVWVGNSDNSSMAGIAGGSGAAPIWHNFMEAALANTPVRNFERPAGIVEAEVCADSGTRPTQHCPQRRTEVFAESQPPPDETNDWYQSVQIDRFSGLRANEFCPAAVDERVMLAINDPRGRAWVQSQPEGKYNGLALAPTEYCAQGGAAPQVSIAQPAMGNVVASGLIQIWGTVQVPDFDHYDVYFGVGPNPEGLGWISGPHMTAVQDGLIAQWDTTFQPAGTYTVIVRAFDRQGRQLEGRVTFEIVQPTAAPTATSEPTVPPPTLEPLIPTLPPLDPIFDPTPTSTPGLPTEAPTLPPPGETPVQDPTPQTP